MADRQDTFWGPRPDHWKMLPWCSFATPSGKPIIVTSDSEAKQVTVRIRHKGIVERQIKRNQFNIKGASNQTQISAGQFIISRIDARNGACGIVPEELDGAIVTKDFRVFDFDLNIVCPIYIDSIFRLPITWKLCESVSDGTTNRVRLDMALFDSLLYPIPDLSEQKYVSSFLQSVDIVINDTSKLVSSLRQLQTALIHNLLGRGFDIDGGSIYGR